MKKILLTVAATAALGFAASGYAAPSLINDNVVTSAPYVGVAAGIGGMDTPTSSSSNRPVFLTKYYYKHDLRKGPAARIFGGYLWAIPQVQNLKLGAEAGFNYYSKNSYERSYDFAAPLLFPTSYTYSSKWDYKGYNIDLLGVAKYNFGDSGMHVVGKAGVAYVSQKVTASGQNVPLYDVNGALIAVAPSISKTWKENKFLPEAAIGFGYDFNQHFAADITYAHVFGKKAKYVNNVLTNKEVNTVASVNTLELGVTYTI